MTLKIPDKKAKPLRRNRTLFLHDANFRAFQAACRKKGVNVSVVVDAWIAELLKGLGEPGDSK